MTFTGSQRAYLIGAILIAASVLIFSGLGSQYLWQDEAETALLGVNILKFGLPVASDGEKIISQEWQEEFGDDHLWRWTPWIDKYLAAASMYCFGTNTFAARLPFALLGVINVLMVYVVARAIFDSEAVGILSAVIITCSVPFLLFTRQCRYYSPMIFAVLALLYFFFAMIRERRFSAAGFIVSAVLLFHSNYVAFFTAFLSLGAGYTVCFRSKGSLKKIAIPFVAAIAANIPGMLFFEVFQKRGIDRVNSIVTNALYYLRAIHHFFFPVLLAAVFIIFVCSDTTWRGERLGKSARGLGFLVVFCAVSVAAVSLLPWSFIRYIVQLLPLMAMITAYMLFELFRAKKAWVIALLLFVGVLHIWHPGQVWPSKHQHDRTLFRNMFPKYLYEITHDYNGPLEHLAGYLNKNAGTSESVFVSYGDLVISFYTGLRVFGGQSGIDLAERGPPDWMIVRNYFSFIDREIAKRFFKKNREAVERWLSQEEYEEIDFPDVPELLWENRPDPEFHMFQSKVRPPRYGTVRLYKKMRREPERMLRDMSGGVRGQKDAKSLNDLGVRKGSAGMLDEAIELFNEAIAIDPLYAETYNNFGYAYYKKGDRALAIRYFKKALEIDPGHERARANLERLLRVGE
ncbi:MAG: tetratricopeptide repeat protein [Candidatus Omnitrophota bacterium]